jgi:hypothetical protein
MNLKHSVSYLSAHSPATTSLGAVCAILLFSYSVYALFENGIDIVVSMSQHHATKGYGENGGKFPHILNLTTN